MRKIGKARQAKFYKKVLAILTSFGAVKSNGVDYGWNLATEAGNLRISIHDEQYSIFSIFCRFDNVAKAKEKLDNFSQSYLNPYSGKWNFHSKDENKILDDFKNELGLITK